MVPHNVELQEEFHGEGFHIVGVTNESKSDTEPWIKSNGATYAYAYDNRSLTEAVGIEGYPTAILVDATGRIVWRDHPASLSAGAIKKHLKGAIELPMWEWPEEAEELKQAIRTGTLAEAMAAAEKLDVKELKGVPKLLEAKVENQVTAFEALIDSMDVLGAEAALEGTLAILEGLDVQEDVRKLASKLETAKFVKMRELQERVVEIEESLPRNQSGVESMGEDALEDLEKELEKIAKANKKKAVGAHAESLLQRVEQMLRSF